MNTMTLKQRLTYWLASNPGISLNDKAVDFFNAVSDHIVAYRDNTSTRLTSYVYQWDDPGLEPPAYNPSVQGVLHALWYCSPQTLTIHDHHDNIWSTIRMLFNPNYSWFFESIRNDDLMKVLHSGPHVAENKVWMDRYVDSEAVLLLATSTDEMQAMIQATAEMRTGLGLPVVGLVYRRGFDVL